jgi:hypothetical protein
MVLGPVFRRISSAFGSLILFVFAVTYVQIIFTLRVHVHPALRIRLLRRVGLDVPAIPSGFLVGVTFTLTCIPLFSEFPKMVFQQLNESISIVFNTIL